MATYSDLGDILTSLIALHTIAGAARGSCMREILHLTERIQMSKGMRIKVGALGATILLLVAVVVAAVGITGAYFSESKSGEVKGTIGSIHVATSGGTGTNGLEFTFANLLPGEPQTANVEYENTGANAEDVWVVFNNKDALHSLNTLGHYGEVTISNSGGWVFHSTNPQDNQAPGNSGWCAKVQYSTNEYSEAGCWPLKEAYKIASNVAPKAGSWMHFSFGYTGKLANVNNEEGTPFNPYPYVSPTKAGLPYEIVATQVGITPGQEWVQP